jgi:hypothetical protein
MRPGAGRSQYRARITGDGVPVDAIEKDGMRSWDGNGGRLLSYYTTRRRPGSRASWGKRVAGRFCLVILVTCGVRAESATSRGRGQLNFNNLFSGMTVTMDTLPCT